MHPGMVVLLLVGLTIAALFVWDGFRCYRSEQWRRDMDELRERRRWGRRR